MGDQYDLGLAERLFDAGLGRGFTGGIRVVESLLMTKPEQYFFPRSKKKRIKKKCAKKYVRQVPDTETWRKVGDRVIVCHPILAQELRKTINNTVSSGFTAGNGITGGYGLFSWKNRREPE